MIGKINIAEAKVGTECIICYKFIEVKYPYSNIRLNNEYICDDCRQVIMALKEVGVQNIAKLLKEENHND